MSNLSSLVPLFEPRSVALIGASKKEYSIGNVIIKNLLNYNYNGPVYPINPKGEEIHGLQSYKSILEVPGEVDLVHIVIPPQLVPEEVEKCGKKGVKAIIINTAGFKEMGSEGQALEKDFLSRARKYKIRIFGPNCQGIINSDPAFRAYCNFTFTFFKPGSISIVAQSGGVGALIMQAFHDMGIGMRLYASNGNASDITITDILNYYGEDNKTKVIVLYIESIPDAKEFMDTARKVTTKKPVLAISAGRTESGAAASISHTGGLAGGITMELIFRKAAILSFNNLEGLCHASIAFATQPVPAGKQVGVITNTGGPGIIATDELVSCGLSIPPLSHAAKLKLKETMLESATINNPLDVVATAQAHHFKSALETMMSEDHIHSVYITFVTPPFVDSESVAKTIAEISGQTKKPLVCNYITDKERWRETTNILREGGVPCYDYPETAARALSAMVRYYELKSREISEVKIFTDVNKTKVRSIIDAARSENRNNLSSAEVYSILESYKIPVAGWSVANTAEEAAAAAEKLGFPVVLKADSEKIIHKSDAGGVAINLKSIPEVKEAAQRMQKAFGEKDFGFFIQEFMPQGTELIIGAKKEEGLGHLIMFGLGGIFVEIYQDVVVNIAPVSEYEAVKMLTGICAAKLLSSYRGKPRVSSRDIVQVIQRISQLVCDIPEIKELDINPLFAYTDRVCSVDGRIIV